MRRCAGQAGEAQKDESNEDFVQVRRRDLERLTTEVMQLRDFLPKILDGDIVWTFQKLDAIESMEVWDAGTRPVYDTKDCIGVEFPAVSIICSLEGFLHAIKYQ